MAHEIKISAAYLFQSIAQDRHPMPGEAHPPRPGSIQPYRLELRVDPGEIAQHQGRQGGRALAQCDPPAPQEAPIGQRAIVARGETVVVNGVGCADDIG